MTLYYLLSNTSLVRLPIAGQTCFIPQSSFLLYNENEDDIKDGKARIYSENKIIETNNSTINVLRPLLKNMGYVDMIYKTNIPVEGTDGGIVEECTAYRMRDKLRVNRFVRDPQLFLAKLPADISDLTSKYTRKYAIYSTKVNSETQTIDILRKYESDSDTEIVASISLNFKGHFSYHTIQVENSLYIFVMDRIDATYHYFIFYPESNTVKSSHTRTTAFGTGNDKVFYVYPLIYFYNFAPGSSITYYNVTTSTFNHTSAIPISIKTIFESGLDAYVLLRSGIASKLIYDSVNDHLILGEPIKLIKYTRGNIIMIVSNGKYIVYVLLYVGDNEGDTIYSYNKETKQIIERNISTILSDETSSSDVLYNDKTGYYTGISNSINIQMGNGNTYRINPKTLGFIQIESKYDELEAGEFIFNIL